MTAQTEYTDLFQALLDARESYARLRRKGATRSDAELARDPDYRRLHRSGVIIAAIGGEAAIASAVRCFGNDGEQDPDVVESELSRLWFGMGTWRH